jgi:hypothetical protein
MVAAADLGRCPATAAGMLPGMPVADGVSAAAGVRVAAARSPLRPSAWRDAVAAGHRNRCGAVSSHEHRLGQNDAAVTPGRQLRSVLANETIQSCAMAGTSRRWAFWHAVDMRLGDTGGIKLTADGHNPPTPRIRPRCAWACTARSLAHAGRRAASRRRYDKRAGIARSGHSQPPAGAPALRADRPMSAVRPGLVLPGQAHAQGYRAAFRAAADGDLIADPAGHLQARREPAGSRCCGWPGRRVPAVADLGQRDRPPGDLQLQPGQRRAAPDRAAGDLINRDQEITGPPAAQARPHRPLGHRPAYPPQVTSAEPRRVRRGRPRSGCLPR